MNKSTPWSEARKEEDIQVGFQEGFNAWTNRGKDGDPRAPYDGRTAKGKAWYAGWKDAAEQAGKGAA